MLSLHIREPPDALSQIHYHEGSETHDTAKTENPLIPYRRCPHSGFLYPHIFSRFRPPATQAMRCSAVVPTQITVLSGSLKNCHL